MISTTASALEMQPPSETAPSGILRWLLTGAIVCLPIQLETPFEIRFAPSDLFLVLAVLLGLGVWRAGRSTWSVWHIGLLSLFFVWVLAKGFLVGAIQQYDLVNKLGGIILLFSLYTCLTSLADGWGDIRWFLKVFVLSVTLQNTVCCAAFLWCRYSGSTDGWLMMLLSDNVDRLAAMLVDPNAYGGLLAVAFAIVLLADDRERPLMSRWLRVACLLSLSIGLLLTSSRSAWMGCGLLTLFGVARNPRLLLALPLMIGVSVAAVAVSVGADSFDSLLTISSRQNTIDERVEINENALKMFLAHPVFGGGIGAYSEEHGIIVHNSVMWFLAEFGLVGFMIFTGFVSWFGVRGILAYRRVDAPERSLIAGLIAAHLAMIGFSLGIEASFQRSWWLVMGLLAASCALADRMPDSSLAELPDDSAPASAEPRLLHLNTKTADRPLAGKE